MYDIERINVIIKDIEKYFEGLRGINLNKENISLPEKYFSASMIMFSILNRAIDLATEIIVKNEFGMPVSYKQYFEVLGEKGIVDKNLSKELGKLMEDRNLFAHQYFDMDRKKVLGVSKRIYYVKDFVERVKKIVQKESRK